MSSHCAPRGKGKPGRPAKPAVTSTAKVDEPQRQAERTDERHESRPGMGGAGAAAGSRPDDVGVTAGLTGKSQNTNFGSGGLSPSAPSLELPAGVKSMTVAERMAWMRARALERDPLETPLSELSLQPEVRAKAAFDQARQRQKSWRKVRVKGGK